MPRHSKTRKSTRKYRGGSIMSWIRDKAVPWLKKAHTWVRDKKIISRVAGLIPHPYAQAISTGASTLGYGRRIRRIGRGCK